jgi:hypothetical protein
MIQPRIGFFFRHTSSFSAIARSKYAAWLIETARNDMKPYETVPRGAQSAPLFSHIFSHMSFLTSFSAM